MVTVTESTLDGYIYIGCVTIGTMYSVVVIGHQCFVDVIVCALMMTNLTHVCCIGNAQWLGW